MEKIALLVEVKLYKILELLGGNHHLYSCMSYYFFGDFNNAIAVI